MSTAAWCLAGDWDEVKVLPKSPAFSLQKSADDSTSVAKITEIEWPATVSKVDGQWLRLGDEGGRSVRPAEGWVKKDNVIKLDDAQETAAQKIREAKPVAAGSPDAELAHQYWLRGVYWENAGEPENAIADYREAIAKKPKTGDFYLRLGRVLAKRAKRDSNLQLDPTGNSFESSRRAFEQAQAAFGKDCPPQLYLSWGEALFDRYCVAGDSGSANEAMTMLTCAECLNPSWFVAPHRRGKLLLDLLPKTESADQKQLQEPPRVQLLEAIEHFTRSIRLNPNAIDPYRDRADALLRLARFSKSNRAILDQASLSVGRANELGNNREPGSLVIKASVQVAIANSLYADAVNPGEDLPSDPKAIAKIALKQSMLETARDLAEEAAHLSKTTDEIDQRLELLAQWGNEALQLANYLAGKPSPVAALKDVSQIVEPLAAKLTPTDESPNSQKAAKNAAEIVGRLQPDSSPERIAEAFEAVSKPIYYGLMDDRTSKLDRAELVRAQEKLKAATARANVFVPTYIPLYLNAR